MQPAAGSRPARRRTVRTERAAHLVDAVLVHLRRGRLDEARCIVGRALAYSEARLGMVPFALSYLNVSRALVHLADGELKEALERAGLGLDFAERIQAPLEQGAAHRALGQIQEAARDIFVESIEANSPFKAGTSS